MNGSFKLQFTAKLVGFDINCPYVLIPWIGSGKLSILQMLYHFDCKFVLLPICGKLRTNSRKTVLLLILSRKYFNDITTWSHRIDSFNKLLIFSDDGKMGSIHRYRLLITPSKLCRFRAWFKFWSIKGQKQIFMYIFPVSKIINGSEVPAAVILKQGKNQNVQISKKHSGHFVIMLMKIIIICRQCIEECQHKFTDHVEWHTGGGSDWPARLSDQKTVSHPSGH